MRTADVDCVCAKGREQAWPVRDIGSFKTKLSSTLGDHMAGKETLVDRLCSSQALLIIRHNHPAEPSPAWDMINAARGNG